MTTQNTIKSICSIIMLSGLIYAEVTPELQKIADARLKKFSDKVKLEGTRVMVTFSGFENLSRNDIEITKKNNFWQGIIKLSECTIEFIVHALGMKIWYVTKLNDDTTTYTFTRAQTYDWPFDVWQLLVDTLKVESLTSESFCLSAEQKATPAAQKLLTLP